MSTRERFDVIGKPRRRVDGRSKVTGQTRFADDIVLPRMVHAKLLRSPHPHARIIAIDASRAAAAPGVHLVLTGKDFPVTFGILPVSLDEYPLAPERVRYVGDPVAAVVAKDEQTATEALDLIDVEYEILPTIATPEEALARPDVRIHDYDEHGNIHRNQAFEFGDVDAALKASDHVFEDLFFFEGNTHLPIEQHAAVGAVDGEGKLTLWSSTQVPHYVHRQMARVLGVPEAHIRIIACPNGGGFGGKTDICNHEAVVLKAAQMLGRPVKICLNREEVFYLHRGRHPVLMKFRTGVNNDGSITGMHLQTLLDGGGYGSYGAASTFYTGALQTVTYEIPRYKFEACRMFTNKPACGPKRGHGTPQPRFGQEIQLDKIAAKLDIDPAELRLKIVAKPNTLTANWMRIGTDRARRMHPAGRDRGRTGRTSTASCPAGRGVGIACGAYMCGAGLPIYWNKMPHSGVQLLLDRSGQVTVFCGATEIGQGSDDVLAGIVAEVLGIDPYDVRCVTGDTGLTPVDLGSYSSRVTVMMGNAAIQAGERVKAQLAAAVAAELDSIPDRIVFSQGRAFVAGESGEEALVSRSGRRRRSQIRHDRRGRLLFAAEAAGALQRRRRRPVARVLVHGVRRRGRRRRCDRLDPRPEDLDRARHRPRAQSRAGPRPGRGQRVHGPRRGADGGAGVPPSAAQALGCARPQDAVDARIQEPDLARHAGDRHDSRRGSRSELPVRREGGRAGAPAARDARGRERDLGRGRRAHRRVADHARKKCCAHWRSRPPERIRASAPSRFPDVPYPDPMIVPPPWEGGDGNAVEAPARQASRPKEPATP